MSGVTSYFEAVKRREQSASANFASSTSPDAIAKANALSRDMGVPADFVDRNLGAVETQFQARRASDLIREYPTIGKWGSDPRNAAMAGDDLDALKQNARYWRDKLSSEGTMTAARAPVANFRNFFSGVWTNLVEGGKSAKAGFSAIASDVIPISIPKRSGVPTLGDFGFDNAMRSYNRAQSNIDAARPDFGSGWKGKTASGLYSGVSSLAQMVPGVAVGALTGGAGGALTMAAPVGLEAYGKYRSRGASPGMAGLGASGEAGIEAVTELLPMKFLVESFGKVGFKPFVAGLLGREIPGEQLATITQDAIDTAIANPDKTWGEYLRERPDAAYETLVASLVPGVLVGGSSEVARKLHQREQAVQAETDAAFLDQLATGVQSSKVAKRDPSAFARFLELQAEGSPVESLYIPAEKLTEYFQSNDMDYRGDDSGFNFDSGFAEQYEEASVSGGDVVIKTADFAAHVAGTPAWDALKDHVRLSAGGVSLAEARSFNEGVDAAMEVMGEEYAAQVEADRAAVEPRQKLYQSVRDKLTNAGFTQSAADTNAALVTARYATRASRKGLEIKGDEFDSVAVNQVLPEKLAPIVAADQLDIVIDAMKRDRAQRSDAKKFGPSLLEWIAAQGGIEDKGGDLASMGAGEWHKGKVGKRKLIRAHQQDDPSFLPSAQQNANSPDELALRAQEAGYFPVGERPSLDALRDAIDAELRGKPVYAEDRSGTTDQVREAADELAALLDQEGLDAGTASKADIRKAVERYQAEQMAGRGYDQADVKSAAFKAWFGDSKVVDAAGKPLVVYHGTNQPIDNFDTERLGNVTSSESSKHGFFFTNDPHVASLYAANAASRLVSGVVEFERKSVELKKQVDLLEKQAQRTGNWDAYEAAVVEWEDLEIGGTREEDSGQNVVPAYLSIQNPKVIDFEGETILKLNGGFGDAIAKARKEGHDGLILRNINDTPNESRVADHYVIFEPTQIKSVNNRGTFDPADPRILHQPAYHGSPHIFDRFSTDAIGTGEGAQAYGYGLYFAGKKQIAEFYRGVLTRDTYVTADGKQWSPDELQHLNFRVMARRNGTDLALTLKQIEEGGFSDSDMRRADVATLERLIAEGGIQENNGRLYEVEIPEDNEYLLWDKSLRLQPDALRKLEPFRAAIEGQMSAEDTMAKTLESASGEMVYRFLSQHLAQIAGRKDADEGNGWNVVNPTVHYNDEAASKALHDAGIAGIKYLDGGSRSDGDGTHNYVVFDDSRVSIRSYEQSFMDGPRGRITFPAAGFGTGPSVIDLFQARDPSTFLHETGHLWLEELRFDAEQPGATDQIRADWQAVQDWFATEGHDLTGSIPVDAHEMWARGVERFLMEGKAPSTGLRKVFDTFRSWLVSIYQVVNNLRAPITPEIRGVMARLIATDAEIAEARQEQGIKALFTDAASARMTEPVFAEYQKLVTEARDEAFDALLFRTMATVRRERTKAWKDERDSVKADATELVNARPEFRALALMRTKGSSIRLDRAWLVETYGEDALALLPKGVPPIYGENGTNADAIAEMSGFSTGDDLVRTLMAVGQRSLEMKEGGDLRSVRAALIEDETAAVMAERHGDPLSDGSIEEEALTLIHNGKQGEVIASELRELGKRSNRQATSYALARQWAAETIAKSKVADSLSGAALQRYARAARNAAKLAEEAMLKGDVDETYRQKQRQMLNNALIAEAGKAKAAVDAAVTKLAKVAKRATMKGVAQDYLDQAHALLEAVDMRQRTQRSVDRQESFETWAESRRAEGHDVVVPASFEATLGQTNWSRLSVEKLLGLKDAVDQVIHLGRYKQTLLDNKERREFDVVVAEAVDGLGDLRQRPPASLAQPGFFDAIRAGVESWDTALLKVETIVDWLDGGKSEGVFNRIVFKPIAEAQDRETNMLKDYQGRVVAAMKALPEKTLARWQEKVAVNLGGPFGGPTQRQQLVSMALNMGNAGNIQRLTDGYGWSEQSVWDVLERELKPEDWAFVQQVWDIVDSLWPQIEAMEKRINGIAPEKVGAVPRLIGDVALRGGYYPAIYDGNLSIDAEVNSGKESDLFEAVYTRANTTASATKARAQKVKRPILLQLGVINRHLGEVIHDITHREAIMQADKFLSDRRIIAAIDGSLGPEYRKMFRPWLKFIANQWAMERAGNEGLAGFLAKARTNTTVVGMGFRITTILTQIAGYSNSFEYVGAKWVSAAIASTARHPIDIFNFVMEKSGEVRNRMDTIDRDVREGIARLAGKAGFVSEAKRFAFHGIGLADRMVVIPTWIGAYNKAIASGATEDAAIYEGDKAVRKSQGSGAAKDMAAVQRGTGKAGELLKYMTMFYSYMSAMYQRQRTLGRDVRAASPADAPEMLSRFLWLAVVPPVLAGILSGNGPDEDEDWATWTFKEMLFNALGPIPVVRDLARPVWDKVAGNPSFGYSLSPVQRAGQTMIEAVDDIADIVTGEETKKATRNIMEAIGYSTGLVPGQIAQSTQFIVDVAYGEQDPEGVAEWIEGLTKGKIKDD